eukprot:116059-Chlamydomonas_euryale.AAC.2
MNQDQDLHPDPWGGSGWEGVEERQGRGGEVVMARGLCVCACMRVRAGGGCVLRVAWRVLQARGFKRNSIVVKFNALLYVD